MVAAERARKAEVFLDRVPRPQRREEQNAAERDADCVRDRQASDVGSAYGDDEQRPSDQQGEEEDAPNDEASVAKHARQQAVAELGAPEQRHR